MKWHPWLTALGLRSYYRLRYFSGQFSDLTKQAAQPPTLFVLDPETDWVWEVLYRLQSVLPVIEAVYGSAAYVYVEPGVAQAIYVTPSGYLIKRHQ